MYFIKINEGGLDYLTNITSNYGIYYKQQSLIKYIIGIGISVFIFLCYFEIMVYNLNTFLWLGGHLLGKLPYRRMIIYKEEITKLIKKIV